MSAFRCGKTYVLHRKASRDIEVDCVTHWLEPQERDAKLVRHVLFSMGLRQASKYGSMTAPKVWLDQTYAVERPDGKTVWVLVYRQSPGPHGERMFWAKRVKKPKDWPD